MKLGLGLSFSWKRALGVTKAKRRVSKNLILHLKTLWKRSLLVFRIVRRSLMMPNGRDFDNFERE